MGTLRRIAPQKAPAKYSFTLKEDRFCLLTHRHGKIEGNDRKNFGKINGAAFEPLCSRVERLTFDRWRDVR